VGGLDSFNSVSAPGASKPNLRRKAVELDAENAACSHKAVLVCGSRSFCTDIPTARKTKEPVTDAAYSYEPLRARTSRLYALLRRDALALNNNADTRK
jgi:hypothetical protein